MQRWEPIHALADDGGARRRFHGGRQFPAFHVGWWSGGFVAPEHPIDDGRRDEAEIPTDHGTRKVKITAIRPWNPGT
jgi:hypothetical protein